MIDAMENILKFSAVCFGLCVCMLLIGMMPDPRELILALLKCTATVWHGVMDWVDNLPCGRE